MKVLVTGSRHWTDKQAIADALTNLAHRATDAMTVIHGGARGADTLAAEVAHEFGWKVVCVLADWGRLGVRAGSIRNGEMLKLEPDYVVAFPLGESRGTRDMIRRAVKARVSTLVRQENGDLLWLR